MSFRVVRQSKFRHVFGKAERRDKCYDNIRITKVSWEAQFCAVNPKYLAIITEAAGGGAFLVLPLSKVGRIERDAPLVCGHKAAVLDVAFCPYNDDIIASASEDCTIKIWQIPEGGLTRNLDEPIVELFAHQRRVGIVVWHPSAQNILLSGGSDNKIFVWDAGRGEALVEIELPDIPLAISWNYNGSKFVTSCKDKYIRVFNPRTGEMLNEVKGHEGSKPIQVVYMKDNKVFSTGFSKMSERQYKLWDENLNKITEDAIDTSNGTVFPVYDHDSGVIFLCGKGDSVIRYFEVTEEAPYVHYLNSFQSSDPQRGIGMMPKRGVNVNNNEIARFYKLHQKGLCEVIPFTVPRKSELFQEDLYPDCAAEMPAITADEWFDGKDSDPVLMSLRENFKGGDSGPSKVRARKPNALAKPIKALNKIGTPSEPAEEPPKPAASSVPSRLQQPKPEPTPAPVPAPTPAEPVRQRPVAPPKDPISLSAPSPRAAPQQTAASQPQPPAAAQPQINLPPDFNLEEVLADVKNLKDKVKIQEKRIQVLEDKLAQLEAAENGEAEEEYLTDDSEDGKKSETTGTTADEEVDGALV